MSVDVQSNGSTDLKVQVSGAAVVGIAEESGFSTTVEVAGGPAGPAAPSTDLHLVAATDLGGHRAIAVNAAGEAVYADPAAVDQFMPVGVSIGAAALGEIITVRSTGVLEEPSWNWSPGFVWVGPDGALQQNSPGAGCVVLVGAVAGPTKLRISPQIIAKC